jgi:hypothetical protein
VSGDPSGERLVFDDITILLRLTGDATGGAFTWFEELPPLVDTPAHVHANEDEVFYALAGAHPATSRSHPGAYRTPSAG